MKKEIRALFLCGVLGAFILLILFGCSSKSSVEEWPTRPISIIVGFKPGGGQDVTMRSLQPALAEFLKVSVNVVNMPGASGSVAAEYVYKQPPDGYTWYSTSSSIGTWPTSAVSDLHYKQFDTLHINVSPTSVISVPFKSPYKDMNDLIKAMKSGETTASNSGLMDQYHVPQAALANILKVKIRYVPYEGGAPAALAVVKGEVDWGTHTETEGKQFFIDKLSRPLACFSNKPLELVGYGAIPAITDYVPEMKDTITAIAAFRGIAVRKDVSDKIKKKITEACKFAVASEKFKEWAKKSNLKILDIEGEEAERIMEQTTKLRSWLMYDLGVGNRSPEKVGVPRP
jgi:tripartite-type tricarboxylate transporter receptor subunit TctC